MKESEVTDKQILDEAKIIFANPKLRRCKACTYSDEECTWCSKMKKPLTKYMYAGLCKYFETNEERIIRETREAIKEQEKEEQKLNHLLTMCLNCIDVAMLFLEDFASRVEKEYRKSDIAGTGDAKTRKSDRNWIMTLKRANNEMTRCIEGARRQYNHFVMPLYNKVFFDKEVNKYDVEMYDDHQSDTMELAHLVLRYFDVAYLNKSNADAVVELMSKMESCGVMEERDFNHYNFKR